MAYKFYTPEAFREKLQKDLETGTFDAAKMVDERIAAQRLADVQAQRDKAMSRMRRRKRPKSTGRGTVIRQLGPGFGNIKSRMKRAGSNRLMQNIIQDRF